MRSVDGVHHLGSVAIAYEQREALGHRSKQHEEGAAQGPRTLRKGLKRLPLSVKKAEG